MGEKVIWSTNMTRDYLLGLSDEEKKNALADMGYDDEEMMAGADLDEIISSDDGVWQQDADEFEHVIAPMISKQTYNGLVLMCGDAKTWQGSQNAGKCVEAEELAGGDIDKDVDNVEIVNDGEGFVWKGHHHDGTHSMKLYAIPENHDNQRKFVETCMKDYIEELTDWHEYEPEEAIETAIADLDSSIINNYCDFSKVPEACQRIKSEYSNEGLTEDTTEDDLANVNSKKFYDYMIDHDEDPSNVELKDTQNGKSIKLWSQASKITIDFSSDGSVDYHEVTEGDPDEYDFDVEVDDRGNYQLVHIDQHFNTWSSFVRWLKDDHWFWTSDNGNDLEEACSSINEVKSKDPSALGRELKEIEDLALTYGYEYFTSMPFTAYEGDPESVEARYPHFFKVCVAFFKEMGIVTNIKDTDELDDEWYQDIDQHDWDTIIQTCHILVEKPHHSAQIEKVFKNNFDDGLDASSSVPTEEPTESLHEDEEEEVFHFEPYDGQEAEFNDIARLIYDRDIKFPAAGDYTKDEWDNLDGVDDQYLLFKYDRMKDENPDAIITRKKVVQEEAIPMPWGPLKK